jgi:hypothetical protein
MYTHPRRSAGARRVLGIAVAGALAMCALTGPAMAATGDGTAVPQCRKAGDKPVEYLTAGDPTGAAGALPSDGGTSSIIAVL